MVQLSYTQDPVNAYAGQPADEGFKDDVSTVVEETNGIDPGLLVMRAAGGDKTAQLPPAVAVDVDAIVTTLASAAGILTLDTVGELDGAIGMSRISPPSKIDFIFDSDADWDATNITLVGKDENGVQRTESISIPNGGNATVSSTGYFSFVESITIPAQSGTGGSMTVGVQAAAGRTLDGSETLGVSVRTHKVRQDQSTVDSELYEDEAPMPVRRKGRLYVEIENAFSAGDRVLVRVVAGASEQLGAFRVDDTDSGDAIPWGGGRLLTSGSAGELGVLQIDVDGPPARQSPLT